MKTKKRKLKKWVKSCISYLLLFLLVVLFCFVASWNVEQLEKNENYINSNNIINSYNINK